MKVELEIPSQELFWEDNASLSIKQPSKHLVEIVGNKEGLISLAKQLLTVAYANDYIFVHHSAEINSSNGYVYGDLDEGSLELSIVKEFAKGRKLNNT